jgi:hypothetical protein
MQCGPLLPHRLPAHATFLPQCCVLMAHCCRQPPPASRRQPPPGPKLVPSPPLHTPRACLVFYADGYGYEDAADGEEPHVLFQAGVQLIPQRAPLVVQEPWRHRAQHHLRSRQGAYLCCRLVLLGARQASRRACARGAPDPRGQLRSAPAPSRRALPLPSSTPSHLAGLILAANDAHRFVAGPLPRLLGAAVQDALTTAASGSGAGLHRRRPPSTTRQRAGAAPAGCLRCQIRRYFSSRLTRPLRRSP